MGPSDPRISAADSGMDRVYEGLHLTRAGILTDESNPLGFWPSERAAFPR